MQSSQNSVSTTRCASPAASAGAGAVSPARAAVSPTGCGDSLLASPAHASPRASATSVCSVATNTDPVTVLQPHDLADGGCSRSAYYRLQAQLRAERSAFLKELLHARQNAARLERQLSTGGGASSPRGTFRGTFGMQSHSGGPTSGQLAPAPSAESVSAMQVSTEQLVAALTAADALNEVAEEHAVERTRLEAAHAAEVESLQAAARLREAELQRELDRERFDRVVAAETAAVQRKRAERDVDRAVTRRTEALERRNADLQASVEQLELRLRSVESDLSERSAQAAQQSLVISRLQQQLSEGLHERTEMRAALDAVAGQSANLLALQRGELVPAATAANQSFGGPPPGLFNRRRSSAFAALPADQLATTPQHRSGRSRSPVSFQPTTSPFTPAPPEQPSASESPGVSAIKPRPGMPPFSAPRALLKRAPPPIADSSDAAPAATTGRKSLAMRLPVDDVLASPDPDARVEL